MESGLENVRETIGRGDDLRGDGNRRARFKSY